MILKRAFIYSFASFGEIGSEMERAEGESGERRAESECRREAPERCEARWERKVASAVPAAKKRSLKSQYKHWMLNKHKASFFVFKKSSKGKCKWIIHQTVNEWMSLTNCRSFFFAHQQPEICGLFAVSINCQKQMNLTPGDWMGHSCCLLRYTICT